MPWSHWSQAGVRVSLLEPPSPHHGNACWQPPSCPTYHHYIIYQLHSAYITRLRHPHVCVHVVEIQPCHFHRGIAQRQTAWHRTQPCHTIHTYIYIILSQVPWCSAHTPWSNTSRRASWGENPLQTNCGRAGGPCAWAGSALPMRAGMV